MVSRSVFKPPCSKKMGEFLETFGDRNLLDDDKLAELVDQARDVVSGHASLHQMMKLKMSPVMATDVDRKESHMTNHGFLSEVSDSHHSK